MLKPMTEKQQKLIETMESYGCQKFSDWLLEHPNLEKCCYTASQYIEEYYDFFKEQKRFMM